ncbi:hypothetical protein ACHQM5_024049 [Ranunculus cassubicifolius]
MAKNKGACTCVLLLVLIFSHEMHCAEGRRLDLTKRTTCLKCSSPDTRMPVKEEKASGVTTDSHHKFTTTDDFVDAFRPTTPGHSPGIGHSLKN